MDPPFIPKDLLSEREDLFGFNVACLERARLDEKRDIEAIIDDLIGEQAKEELKIEEEF
jgi:hypothetical protein